MHKKFDSAEIEKKWQKQWQLDNIYRTDQNSSKPKTYVLDMFPYPSGEGLHVGHPKGYIATDIYSRFKRMTGHEVLHPMGWDAFGLPAENFAIKNKIHPKAAVEKNVARFKEQLEILGFDYDWSREINTTDPEYYKWTQWIFIQLLKKGLAKESYEPINWCPGCQTGLANEDLESDGTCERCGSVVEKKPMRQWVLNIRAYADRMLEDLDTLAWPEHIKEAQRNWIGRSEGAEIDFNLSINQKVTVFTTRPDTLFGVTYLVLAPEHPLIKENAAAITNIDAVRDYITLTKQKDEKDRLDATKEKTGVKLEGITAANPVNGEVIPVYIADYVLASYGTGAIMAVPAHDERDNAFAKKFGIAVKQVIAPHFAKKEGELNQRQGVYALIKNERNEYLVQFYTNSGHYWLTGGGRDENETELECLKREILEEAGYNNFSIQGKVGTAVYDYITRAGDKGRNFTNVYEVEIHSDDQQNVAFTQEEIEDGLTLCWYTKEELRKLVSKVEQERIDLILEMIEMSEGKLYTGSGILLNSGEFDGMSSKEAAEAIIKKVGGRVAKTYKIKDWVFSRQRYWGEPIPVVHLEDGQIYPIAESQLPVTLPEVEHYEPSGDGQSPLANISEWVNVTGYVTEDGTFIVTSKPPEGTTLVKAKRETNTMPQWAGSSWYYLRYIDPKNSTTLVDKELEKKWGPVDVYVGGDHAVRHLIYARFWHKFLFDIGAVSTIEPFQRLEFLGFILAEDGRKMSKRWGNVINPDDIVKLVGADTLRVYEMFMGPFENTIAWSQDGLVGARRFLERVNGLASHIIDNESNLVTSALQKTIKKITEDIEAFKFNTAVSALMIFLNVAEKDGLGQASYECLLKLIAPFAPHLTEELWQQSRPGTSIHLEAFPIADETLTVDENVTIGVQINGKLRGTIVVSKAATEKEAMNALPTTVTERISGSTVKKVIYVPGRILNLIVDEPAS